MLRKSRRRAYKARFWFLLSRRTKGWARYKPTSSTKVQAARAFAKEKHKTIYKKKKDKSLIFRSGFYLVLVTGVEPVRVLPHGILSPGRLPIPPHQQVLVLLNESYYIISNPKCQHLFSKKFILYVHYVFYPSFTEFSLYFTVI